MKLPLARVCSPVCLANLLSLALASAARTGRPRVVGRAPPAGDAHLRKLKPATGPLRRQPLTTQSELRSSVDAAALTVNAPRERSFGRISHGTWSTLQPRAPDWGVPIVTASSVHPTQPDGLERVVDRL